MEKITVPIIEMMGKKCICIPEEILERLNFHNPLELIIDEVAQQIHIKASYFMRQELEQVHSTIPSLIEDDISPVIKIEVDSDLDFNPWDD